PLPEQAIPSALHCVGLYFESQLRHNIPLPLRDPFSQSLPQCVCSVVPSREVGAPKILNKLTVGELIKPSTLFRCAHIRENPSAITTKLDKCLRRLARLFNVLESPALEIVRRLVDEHLFLYTALVFRIGIDPERQIHHG